MATVLDHTIVPVRDREKSWSSIPGFSGLKNWAKLAHFWRCGSMTLSTWTLRNRRTSSSSTIPSPKSPSDLHYAFTMERGEFEAAFTRIRESGIAYGDDPHDMANMKGPGMTMGSQGLGKAVYFQDPDGHVLEIKTY